MANVIAAGFVRTGAGVAVVGATVDAYVRNTSSVSQGNTTTNASGYWTLTVATQDRYDYKVVNGTTTIWLSFDDQIQIQRIETAEFLMMNPANTFKYNFVPAAITADRTLNWPLITGTDTLAALGLAQTFSAIQTFSAVPVLSGGAIGFPATQVASAGANDLDDYEEGTWTVGLTFGGASVGMTFSTRTGRYKKVGAIVQIGCEFLLSNKGSSVGDAVITGLPITTGATLFHPFSSWMETVTFADWPMPFARPVTTEISLEELTNLGVRTTLTNADFANTSNVQIGGGYDG